MFFIKTSISYWSYSNFYTSLTRLCVPFAEYRIRLAVSLFFLWLSAPVFTQVSTPPSVGNGTPASPFEIATLNNLVWIQSSTANWDKHYIQTADINASSTSTWNSSTGWMPIGDLAVPFTGSYNGNGFEISGLTINRVSDYQGLFGRSDGDTLRNIKLVTTSILGRDRVGAVVGNATNATILNCTVGGSVNGRNNVGGVAGFAGTTYINGCVIISGLTMTGASNIDFIGSWVGQHTYGDTINIHNATVNASIRGRGNLGGFFGNTTAPISFYSCHSQGSITSTITTGSTNAGGLVGAMTYNSAAYTPEFIGCSNSGNISGAAGDQVGGIIGWLSKGYILNCANSADVRGRNNVGGIAGLAENTYINQCNVTSAFIERSTVSTSIPDNYGGWVGQHTYGDTITIRNATMNSVIRGRYNLGGFFGTTNAPISFYNCQNQGAITSSAGSSNANTGGLVGIMSYNGATHRPEFIGCSNSGVISGGDGDNIGGIIGNLSKGYILNCSNSADVRGRNNVGGIAGIAINTYINQCNVTSAFIERSTVSTSIPDNYGGWVGQHTYGDTITIRNATMNTVIRGRYNLGGFFGTTNAPISFYNCQNQGAITSSAGSSGANTGGLVGIMSYNGAIHRPEFIGCSNSGVISGGDGDNVGGIIGNLSKGYILNCSNSANVRGRSTVGGIAGAAINTYINQCNVTSAFIERSTASTSVPDAYGGWVGQHTYGDTITIRNATMNSVIRGRYNLGGFFGTTNAPISFYNCHNQGAITSSATASSANTGGLVGIMTYNSATYMPLFSHCSNSGTISGGVGDNVGGIIGTLSRGEIKYSSNTGTISGRSNIGGLVGNGTRTLVYRSFNTGSVTASTNYAGGLSGYIQTASTLEESYNLGAVRANQYAGGLSGAIATNTSSATNCYNHANVWANNRYSGGLTGLLSAASLFHCYSIATFSGSTTDRNGTVGQNGSGTSSSTYWDSQLSGVTTTPAGTGLGLNTTQMQTQSNYVDWNFHTIWHLDACATANGYPILRWQNVDFTNALEPSVGLGTPANPYEISNLSELYWLVTDRKNWDKNFIQTADIDVTTVPTVCGYGYTPIGDRQDAFTGSYNGQQFKIQNLSIDVQSEAFPDLGMFGVSSGTIQNVILEDVAIKGGSRIGGLLGHQTNGLVTRSGVVSGLVESFISGASNTGETGGLIGRAEKNVTQNYVKGGVTVTSVNGQNTGGFLGMFAPSSAAAVEDNYSMAAVSLTGVVSATPPGAFAGTLQATGSGIRILQRNYATGAIGSGTGFIGSSSIVTTADNFYDQQTTGQTTSAGNAFARNTPQMKTMGNYTLRNWDFLCERFVGTQFTWGRSVNDNDGYPWLAWEGYTADCPMWEGTLSEDWGIAGNWYPDEVPVRGAEVFFASTPSNHARLDTIRMIYSLDFNGSTRNLILDTAVLTAIEIIGYGEHSHVVSDSTGRLRMPVNHNEAKVFPLGKSTYTPLLITNRTGIRDTFSLWVMDEVRDNGARGNALVDEPRVDNTWHIGKESPNGGAGVDFQFFWNPGELVGSIGEWALFHYDTSGLGWEPVLNGALTLEGSSLVFTGYTGTFSPFAIGDQTNPLPVDLLYFRAECTIDGMQFNWATASEIHSESFTIEQSVDFSEWLPLSTVPAAGYSNEQIEYSVFVSKSKLRGRYFRLHQLDIDGKFTYYFPTVTDCSFGFNLADLQVFPNPSTGLFTVYGLTENDSWQVIDSMGRKVFNGNTSSSGSPQIDLSHLPPGVYYLISEQGKSKLIRN